MASLTTIGLQPTDADQFVARFPRPVRELADEARQAFRLALPDAVERLYVGWELIGYRVPVQRGTRYVGFVAPRNDSVVLGFEYGVLLVDRFPFLTGDGNQVRQLVLKPGEPRPSDGVLRDVICAAAEIATGRKGDRLARS